MFDSDVLDRPSPHRGGLPGLVEVPQSRLGELDALESALADAAGVLNAAHGRIVELVATALTEGLWAQPGIHTPVQWLGWQLGLSRANARRLVGLAHRAEELPVTMETLGPGGSRSTRPRWWSPRAVRSRGLGGRTRPPLHRRPAGAVARPVLVRPSRRRPRAGRSGRASRSVVRDHRRWGAPPE